MHSYCLFLCWRASKITTHHEPVYLCLHRGADVVPVSGARRPFAWKTSAKSMEIFSLGNKLKPTLSSMPQALWGEAPALLVFVGVTISSCNMPFLFQRNSLKGRNPTEPSIPELGQLLPRKALANCTDQRQIQQGWEGKEATYNVCGLPGYGDSRQAFTWWRFLHQTSSLIQREMSYQQSELEGAAICWGHGLELCSPAVQNLLERVNCWGCKDADLL